MPVSKSLVRSQNWYEFMHDAIFDLSSVVISRPWSQDSNALELILFRSRSRSRDLKSKVSVSRPEDPGLGLGLKTACLVPTPVARLP